MALAALLGAATTARADAPVSGTASGLDSISPEGSHVLFTSAESIAPGDQESGLYQDVYLWSGGQAQLVSSGATGTEHAKGDFVSAGGNRVVFHTNEQLVAEDVDNGRDFYEWSNGRLSLLSTGPADTYTGQAGAAFFYGATDDGSHAFFTSHAPLVADDPPGIDLYERTGGVTRRIVSAQTSPQLHFSADGSRVLFQTTEALAPEDTDTVLDVYERIDGSAPRLVSSGSRELPPAQEIRLATASANGRHVLLYTRQKLELPDLDDSYDVYLRSGGTTRLVSRGLIGGQGANPAFGLAVSDDGSRVVFETVEKLTPDDRDDQNDIYEWTRDGTRLVSTGPGPDATGLGPGAAGAVTFKAASPDARRVVWQTLARFTTDDADGSIDVYQRLNGVTTLLSGPSAGGVVNASARAVDWSRDVTRVFIGTAEGFAGADTDGLVDVYERSGSVLDLTTTGPTDPQQSSVGVGLPCCASADGSAYVWSTRDALTADDVAQPGEDPDDLYLRRGGQTYLVSE